MNNLKSTKINTIFLATVLVLGTIATISPSFMVGAQAEPYYEGMDDRYDSYEAEYADRNNYEPTEYPSDNSYKSKDSSNTIIKKVKCNNINSNNNFVDVNAGIPTDDALVDAQGADNEGQAITANGEGYNNGYKQNSNDFKFVCINNNNNEVVVINETTPPIPLPPPDTITCEECFEENLTPEQLAGLNSFLEGRQPVAVEGFDIEIAINDLAAYCTLISLASTEESLSETVRSILLALNERVLPPEDAIPEPIIEEIIQCVLEALDIDTDTNDITGGLAASNINTNTSSSNINTAGGLVASSFSSPPTIAQGTQDSSDLTATEKITKLKTQWLELLP